MSLVCSILDAACSMQHAARRMLHAECCMQCGPAVYLDVFFQNIELQNQLHILQAEITALSERQVGLDHTHTVRCQMSNILYSLHVERWTKGIQTVTIILC